MVCVRRLQYCCVPRASYTALVMTMRMRTMMMTMMMIMMMTMMRMTMTMTIKTTIVVFRAIPPWS